MSVTTLALGTVFMFCQQPQEPLRALVVSGANNHDWEWTTPEIGRVLTETGRFAVEITYEPAKTLVDLAERHERGDIDVVVLDYNGPRWGAEADASFLKAVEAGCGVTVVHAADNAFVGWKEYEKLVGLLWRKGTGHGRFHSFDVNVVDRHHPITEGMEDLLAHPDELYHRLVLGEGAEFRVLLSALSATETGGTGRHEPMATVGRYGKGRVFHHVLGHAWKGSSKNGVTWSNPPFRRLLARGTEWAAVGEVTLSPVPLNTLSAAESKAGFRLLFDGQRIEHWRAYKAEGPPKQGWVVRDAAIVHEAKGGGGDLITVDQFADFDFRFSFRVAPKANSGVIWHVLETEKQTYMTGPEYQVLDDTAFENLNSKHAVGSLYDLVEAKGKEVRPAGAWNEGRVVIQGGRVQHWVNGTKVVDAPCAGPEWDKMVAGSKFAKWPFGRSGKGHLALQDHGDEVAYRNLRIKNL